MATGYFAAGRCFQSQQQAQDMYLSESLPLITPIGTYGTWHDFTCLTNNGGYCTVWSWPVQADGSLGAGKSWVVYPVTPSCELENDPISSTLDGIALGWLVVLSMVIAWGFKLMKDQAK